MEASFSKITLAQVPEDLIVEISKIKLAQVPEDLIVEILLRLPVKSLLCSKVVCKRWYDLIKSNNFKSMHHKFNLGDHSRLLMCSSPRFQLEKYTNNHMFAIRSNDELTRVLSPDFRILANTDTYVLLLPGSCNGIVCYYDDDNSDIFLSNPATREFKQLPPTSFETDIDPKFYQLGVTFGVAFGFASTNIYDFKVLRFLVAFPKNEHPHDEEFFGAEIFTLSSNTWKQLHWGLGDRLALCAPTGLFCADSFHFVAKCHKSPGHAIACCDIHTERFRTMELPSFGKGEFISLVVFKEFLSAMCRFYELSEEKSMDIWIMKDYGVVESWTKLYSIRPPCFSRLPILFWTEKDALLLRRWKNGLFSCHNNTLKSIEIDGYNDYSQFAVYQETLVSIM